MMKFQHNPEEVGHGAVALHGPHFHFRPLTRRAFKVIGRWMERSRQRRALADLDDRLLKDIGITRSEAEREINKLFWH